MARGSGGWRKTGSGAASRTARVGGRATERAVYPRPRDRTMHGMGCTMPPAEAPVELSQHLQVAPARPVAGTVSHIAALARRVLERVTGLPSPRRRRGASPALRRCRFRRRRELRRISCTGGTVPPCLPGRPRSASPRRRRPGGRPPPASPPHLVAADARTPHTDALRPTGVRTESRRVRSSRSSRGIKKACAARDAGHSRVTGETGRDRHGPRGAGPPPLEQTTMSAGDRAVARGS